MSSIQDILKEVERDIKRDYERSYFWTHSVRYQYILKKVQLIAKDKRLKILDIGCFPYHIGKALELLGHVVYGIASEHEPVRNKNITILNVERDRFPYKDNFFDLVLCNEVIEHLPQSPILMLQEIYRVTKKDGFLIVTTPNIARSINRAKLLVGESIIHPIDVYFEENGKGNNIYHRHNREYTLNELRILLAKTSWNIVQSGYFISYTPFRKRTVPDAWWLFGGKFVNYILMLLFPSFQDNLLAIGEKVGEKRFK